MMTTTRAISTRTRARVLTQNETGMSITEIAAELGISQQRVQQLIARAMRKFKAGLAARGIDRLDDVLGTMLLRE